MQEPGAAVLFDSRIIAKEVEADIELEPTLQVVQVDPEKAEPHDHATLVYEIDEESFWNLLVHVRSKDWSDFCDASRIASTSARHDEL